MYLISPGLSGIDVVPGCQDCTNPNTTPDPDQIPTFSVPVWFSFILLSLLPLPSPIPITSLSMFTYLVICHLCSLVSRMSPSHMFLHPFSVCTICFIQTSFSFRVLPLSSLSFSALPLYYLRDYSYSCNP